MFLLMTPSSWQMTHTQHLSCQKIPPGVPPTLATVSNELDCSTEESHHTHRCGKTVPFLPNCTSPTAGEGRRREKRWENHLEFPASLTGGLELPYIYTFNAGITVIRNSLTYKGFQPKVRWVPRMCIAYSPECIRACMYKGRQLKVKKWGPPVPAPHAVFRFRLVHF